MSRLLLDQVVLSGLNPKDIDNEEEERTVDESVESIDKKSNVISNQTVLAITCTFFTLFVIAEIIGALVLNIYCYCYYY